MIATWLCFFTLATTLSAQDFPLCEVCGCPTCESGQFPVGNLNGAIAIPPGLESVSPEDFTQISCSFLEFLGSSGKISPDICDSGFRLESSFRAACDCPLLPGATATPTIAPVTNAPTSASPTLSPTFPVPTNAPTSFLETIEFCLGDEIVNFEDDVFFGPFQAFNNLVSSNDFDPTCSCTFNSNLVEVFLFLQESFFSGEGDLAELDAQAASIDHTVGFSCTNECSACFDDTTCAVISNTQDQRALGRTPNFIADELTIDFFTRSSFFERIIARPGFVHNTTTCATFVSGEEGTICLSILEWVDPEPGSFPEQTSCDITVDGVGCSACSASSNGFPFDPPCIVADCTNIQNGRMIDTCEDGVLTGVYQFLNLISTPLDLQPNCNLSTDAPAPVITETPQPVSTPSPITPAPMESPDVSPSIGRCSRRLR